MKIRRKRKASYSIEASVVMPIYACLMVALLLFFRIISVLWTVEVAMHEVAEEAAYSGVDIDEYLLGAGVSAKVGLHPGALRFVRHGVLGLDYSDSEVTKTDIDLMVHYRVQVPVGLLGPIEFSVTQEAKHRRWVGYDPFEGSVDTEQYVYVAKYGEDYHSCIDCPYLAPSIHAVAGNEVANKRNADGSRYRACRYCHPTKKQVVLITDYGECYHSSRSCGALKRTISRISIHEVGGLRPCPKCYKGA